MPEQDKAILRSQLVPAMLALSTSQDNSIRAQIADSISLIAELDFPSKWPDLINHLVASLSPTNTTRNISVLESAHSIFNPWRAHVRSDALFTEINLILQAFMPSFLHLFRQTSNILLSNTAPSNQEMAVLAQAQCLLLDIFYDFTCQDLPPDLEDAHEEFFAPPNGLFQRFLTWDPVPLRTDEEDTTPSLPSKIKTRILEIAEVSIRPTTNSTRY